MKNLYVTERNKEAFPSYPLIPAERRNEVLPLADIVLITAVTLVNHTLDGILPLCRSAREIAVIGPTTPLCPWPFFRRRATMVGGTHMADAYGMLQAVSEGGTGARLWAEGEGGG